jgi:hypothetical protein
VRRGRSLCALGDAIERGVEDRIMSGRGGGEEEQGGQEEREVVERAPLASRTASLSLSTLRTPHNEIRPCLSYYYYLACSTLLIP